MKNLTVQRRISRSLDFLNETLSGCTKVLHTVDPNNDDFYLLLKNKLYKIPSKYEEDITSFDLDDNLKLVDLEYCSITQELFGLCETGDIVRINVVLGFECEVAAQLHVNLQCMKLSPDHEMLILVTTDGIVITMLSTFQVISEANLYSSEFGSKQFITVGWGKRETQFHGSEGKSAAKAKPVEIIKNEADDGMPRISWREDGTLFAVSFLHKETQIRQFKVFDREGILQYTSERMNGLEESLSWKPSGSLIAVPQNLVNKHIIAFFEKNGLKHREFTLPFQPKEVLVKDLFWSPDSEVLTVWCQTQNESNSILQLWTENNYHWYLKQTLKFSADNDPLIYATWSNASRSKKLILLTSKKLLAYNYDWCINHSRGKSTSDKAVVGVIDGNNILTTGFRVGVVPPPMAHQSLEAIESINAIVFAPNVQSKDSWINSNTFFCVSSSDKLLFYKELTTSPLLEYEYIGSYEVEWNTPLPNGENASYDLHHFLWLDENIILCSASEGVQSLFCVLTLDGINATKQGRVTVQETHVMEGLIEHVVPSLDEKEAYIVVERSVLKYTKGEIYPTDIELPADTYKVEVTKVDERYVMLSLSHRNSFSIDGKQIANNITSFYVHSEYLLLTTLQHTLICVTLSEKGLDGLTKQDLTIKPWEDNFNDKSITDLNVRRVERGSHLVVAISKDSKTILQMPRGNLECIHPRALSLYIVGYHLNNCDYLTAFDLMRKQRINLNLIYDHDPKKFIENAEKFVEEISEPSWLSSFLSELRDVDVTTTTYANYYWKNQAKSDVDVTNKVEFICDLLRNIMERRNNADNFIQPILVALVKSPRKQGLEGSLKKIKEIQNLEKQRSITPEEALRFLLYLVDVNVLFDTALGMYDFDLTMFIASKSQKDPKEYIPFLNQLKKLDENYMKYSIDVHLQRYKSALEHIAKEPTRFNECINLICNHNLYANALKLFEKTDERYKTVARVYGEFLMKKNKYQEAATMFCRSEDFSLALNAYKLAGSWQDVIIVSTQMKLSANEKNELYKELVDRLRSDKRYREAATILQNYLNDVEETVASLCDGKQWKDAVRIACDAKRLDLIETSVKPSVYEYADHIVSQIQRNKEDFEKYKTRLNIVRTNISQRKVQLYDATACDNELTHSSGMSDVLSDTSSIAGSTLSNKSGYSVSSMRSYRSSKNRRKQERKLFSLKEGSAFEDLGLIQALHQIITNTYKEKDDVSALIQMFVRFDDDEYAEKVQLVMEEFLRSIERSKSEIWDKTAPSSLAEMEKPGFATPAQYQELVASRKAIEPFITTPPETNSSQWKLEIF